MHPNMVQSNATSTSAKDILSKPPEKNTMVQSNATSTSAKDILSKPEKNTNNFTSIGPVTTFKNESVSPSQRMNETSCEWFTWDTKSIFPFVVGAAFSAIVIGIVLCICLCCKRKAKRKELKAGMYFTSVSSDDSKVEAGYDKVPLQGIVTFPGGAEGVTNGEKTTSPEKDVDYATINYSMLQKRDDTSVLGQKKDLDTEYAEIKKEKKPDDQARKKDDEDGKEKTEEGKKDQEPVAEEGGRAQHEEKSSVPLVN
ncbi:uncharacterized protein LOC114790003 isoform X2 [Denticeps clupeoides]|uniref:uncharacterized protein LOC114790003 isoform X2 n=1 Tax=Denticeps clupeoides TaxID=299321 RepID=UPI0010A48A56|nr:uncharacterized protein LOC114790003 isoform X2 [Denticeps clupeoides]